MSKRKRVNIHIGEYYASRTPTEVYTFLGSCVAVCLYDPVTRIGGMNHIYLPGRADMKKANGVPARFAINAMELLINAIMNRGGDRHRLKAKAFGGGNLISAITPENSVGGRIAEFVVNFLKIEEIPLLGYDLGGNQGRQIYFHTDTGNAFLKPISPKLTQFLADRDLKEIKSITKKVKSTGDITLF